MTDETTLISYAYGVNSEPLIGETIGDNLERTVARHPDREVLASFHELDLKAAAGIETA